MRYKRRQQQSNNLEEVAALIRSWQEKNGETGKLEFKVLGELLIIYHLQLFNITIIYIYKIYLYGIRVLSVKIVLCMWYGMYIYVCTWLMSNLRVNESFA